MLKPIDIVVLAELVLRSPDLPWSQAELAQKLLVSQPSIHRALKQLERSDLRRGQHTQRSAFYHLIVHAVRYVYPAELGAPARGIPTAYAGSRLSEQLSSDRPYVWPLEEVNTYGPAISPLHPTVPKVALHDRAFHELMALIDVFRVGRTRERRLAEQRLTELDGCRELEESVAAASNELREWITGVLVEIVGQRGHREAVIAHVPRGGDQSARIRRVLALMTRLAGREP